MLSLLIRPFDLLLDVRFVITYHVNIVRVEIRLPYRLLRSLFYDLQSSVLFAEGLGLSLQQLGPEVLFFQLLD